MIFEYFDSVIKQRRPFSFFFTGSKRGVDINEGAVSVKGLASNMVLQSAGTYNATEILGYRVIAQGSANWTLDPKDGSSISVPQGGFIAGATYPEHLESITVGTGGQAVLYIP